MPLQNRVSPFGDLFADPARGLFMGNRGGRIHTDARVLSSRRWASRQWICCVVAFKGRHREVWGDSYTELFFLDEVTALAAGHRPCFECRRADARAFADAWGKAHGRKLRAGEMDAVIHAERLDGRNKRTHRRETSELPDGTMIAIDGAAYAVRGGVPMQWTPCRYGPVVSERRQSQVEVLTPRAIVAVLSAGYVPRWHNSAFAAPDI